MSSESLYLLAADAILVLHLLFVVFVLLGLVLIYLGKWLSWKWVRNFWFRVLHLVAIAYVVIQAWLGAICPLTIWEMQLRQLGGGRTYEGSFIQHWFHAILYYDAPLWVFTAIYTVFAVLVVASWFIVRPDRHKS